MQNLDLNNPTIPMQLPSMSSIPQLPVMDPPILPQGNPLPPMQGPGVVIDPVIEAPVVPQPPHRQVVTEEGEKTAKKRKRKEGTLEGEPLKKKAKRSQSRGLSYFTKRVVEKMQNRDKSTFAEIANEIVSEYCDKENPKYGPPQEEKNVRRRVYDALNVLTALGYIDKTRKEIRWTGQSINYNGAVEELLKEKQRVESAIDDRRRHLLELDRQRLALERLIERNTKPEYEAVDDSSKVKLPFIVVHTEKTTSVECQMDDSAFECFFNFDKPFEIHDDNEVLKRTFFKDLYESPSSQQFQVQQQHQNLPIEIAPVVPTTQQQLQQQQQQQQEMNLQYLAQANPMLLNMPQQLPAQLLPPRE